MPAHHLGKITFETQGSVIVGHFWAMANPCAIFIEHDNNDAVQHAIRLMAKEVWRIEQKYSRYLLGSTLDCINNAGGKAIAIDKETYHLLQLSDVLWQESMGQFDITSGIFRKLWFFNKQQQPPTQQQLDDLLPFVGWQQVTFNSQHIILPLGMQIDFGGIGKEYAADLCIALAPDALGRSVLVNLGGDVVAKGARIDKSPWKIGIETKEGDGKVWKKIPLSRGAIATSGDVYASFIYKGKRYGHIINALTGFPVANSPRTVTVATPSCTEAGMLSTLAILQGATSEIFLQEKERPYWVQR
jgi:thiamine biosynthesis lipoprotein